MAFKSPFQLQGFYDLSQKGRRMAQAVAALEATSALRT